MIRVTETALQEIRNILSEEPEGTVIRVNVSPG
jgi:Fe-S cluster assembly iron-binding protein IscA